MHNLTVIVTPKAGHMVPFAQTKLTMNYVTDFLNYGKLKCKGKTCKDVSAGMVQYMNACTGHGTSDTTGKCTCGSGWYGADCSVQLDTFKIGSGPAIQQISKTKIRGSRWNYFLVKANIKADWTMTVTSQAVKADLFISKGVTELPDEANFDGVIRQEHTVTLNNHLFECTDGFIVGVHTRDIQLNTPATL